MKKKIISILTATRAEYGLLRPVIKQLLKDETVEVRVVVTGAHLSHEFGLTYKEIEQDGIRIDRKIDIMLSSDSPSAISKTMGIAMMSFADYFAERRPDIFIVLGDRYETLAVCCAAANERIPIAHLYGGETTEGALDESFRHAITKLSYLHFTSTEDYRRRVIQLGESPDRVYNVGSLGVENVLHEPLLPRAELEEILDFSLEKPYAVITYHPVTLEHQTAQKQFVTILNVLEYQQNLSLLFTKANADEGGRVINKMIDSYVEKHNNATAFTSLGTQKYLSAVAYSSVVIGNSSSGIIEVPSLHVPTINIGDRQKGRIQAESIINCEPTEKDFSEKLAYAVSEESQQKAKSCTNPYGEGNTSERICSEIRHFLSHTPDNLKKTFYHNED